eukprot:TRINITY_DN10332_c0_g1_i1.p1 TRINITY_DN10332_c0_g1~~TRINITY_DN10332_c0_g1_i1.p1  ORF type:complete len:273 (-),score=34.45 TRINITY_DN10332_c0_g1_i1:109-927(-)
MEENDDRSEEEMLGEVASLSCPPCTVQQLRAKTSLLLFDRKLVLVPAGVALLASLEYLVLHWNELQDVSALSALTGLQKLYLQHNQLKDLSPLSTLTSLTRLHLGYNHLKDVTPLSALTSLRDLVLRNNRLEDLSPLSTLSSLERLDLCNNRLELPPFWLHRIPLLSIVDGNPLSPLPRSVRSSDNYLRRFLYGLCHPHEKPGMEYLRSCRAVRGVRVHWHGEGEFKVFLCHGSTNKPFCKQVREGFRSDVCERVFLDQYSMTGISVSKSAG